MASDGFHWPHLQLKYVNKFLFECTWWKTHSHNVCAAAMEEDKERCQRQAIWLANLTIVRLQERREKKNQNMYRRNGMHE